MSLELSGDQGVRAVRKWAHAAAHVQCVTGGSQLAGAGPAGRRGRTQYHSRVCVLQRSSGRRHARVPVAPQCRLTAAASRTAGRCTTPNVRQLTRPACGTARQRRAASALLQLHCCSQRLLRIGYRYPVSCNPGAQKLNDNGGRIVKGNCHPSLLITCMLPRRPAAGLAPLAPRGCHCATRVKRRQAVGQLPTCQGGKLGRRATRQPRGAPCTL